MASKYEVSQTCFVQPWKKTLVEKTCVNLIDQRTIHLVWINVQNINAFIIPEFIISQNKQNDISIKMREVKTTLQEEKDRLIR